ncbi:MAG: PadR family transcriptional regulator [Candidatus Geothermarchaeales archaeon]
MERRRRSVVPRGFSRYVILSLLKEKPMTGMEIMDEAERRSEGVWRPSPGLVYPLLGRLQERGLIKEVEGKFTLTPKGEEALDQFIKREEEIKAGIDAVKRLSYQIFATGRFLAEEVLDDIMAAATRIRTYMMELSTRKRAEFLKKYKAHLESELRRVEEELEKQDTR